LPQPVTIVKRSGRFLCAADKEYYNVVDIEAGSLLPIFPLTQDPEHPVKPLIAVVSPGEFLVLSWTGANAFGVFVTGEGNPMRGTLEWMQYPLNIGRQLFAIPNILHLIIS
jgi:vacuolar protein sorting-associated protein 3